MVSVELHDLAQFVQQFVAQFLILQGKVDIGREKFGPVAGVKTQGRRRS